METTLRIPDQIYGQHRIINTLDNQKKENIRLSRRSC